MDQNIVISIISASSAVIVAIAALIVNVVWMGRTFDQLGKRIDGLDSQVGKRIEGLDGHMGNRIDGLEKRVDRIGDTLDVIQTDLRVFYKDIAQLKARTGLE